MDQSRKNKILAFKKKAKTFKRMSIVYASVILMMIIIAIVTTQRDGVTFMTFLPLFFIPMEIVNIYQYKKANKQATLLEEENESK
jgi:nicotinamide riboside transporter PnuC